MSRNDRLHCPKFNSYPHLTLKNFMVISLDKSANYVKIKPFYYKFQALTSSILSYSIGWINAFDDI